MNLTLWQRPRLTPSFDDSLAQLFRAFDADLNEAAAFPLNTQWLPTVDLYEKNDLVTVRAEIPGVKKEDINISLENGYLTLSGERKSSRKSESGGVARTERFEGRFERAIRLPYKVDAEAVKATYTDGVLTVEMPKAAEARAKQIKVVVK